MTKVAIGIVAHGEPERVISTLRSVAGTTIGCEVIAIPSGDGDITRAALALFDGLRILDKPSAEGGAACLNRLAKNCAADILILLEPGCIVDPNAIDKLVAALQRPGVGLAGPSTNRAWNEQGVFAGASSDEIEQTAAEAERRFGDTVRSLAPLYSLSDFCYAVKREVFEAIGEADEDYGLGPCWEMDYNVRAARAGFDGVWVCGAYVWRAPITAERERDEARFFEASRRRYQDKFCGARLRGEKLDYRLHCRGDDCPNFAPRATPTTEQLPLVSCIMPTKDRRAFVPAAIRSFFAQDYPNLELVVVDDGDDPVADLLPPDPRVRYFRLPQRLTVGAKRNFACERARGSIIVHWDDDDWYPASRVRVQVAALLARGADICGSSILYFFDRAREEAFLYRYSGGGSAWVAGTTLAYRRAFWERNRFPDIQVGEDTHFVWSGHDASIVDLQDPVLCVAAIHAGNVSSKATGGVYWSPVDAARIQALIDSAPAPEQPLVSCLMATYNRRSFVPLALECFRRQTYANRELLVIDDGDDDVRDLVRDHPAVRYLRVDRRLTLGAKRNILCGEARGEVVALWDDDDWYAATRLERQLAPILAGSADMTGLVNRFLLELPRRKCWTLSRPLHSTMYAGDVPGGTLVFRRSIWAAGIRFPDVSLAEDAAFLREALWRGHRLARVDDDDGGLFLYVRHGANTWQFEAGTFINPAGWSESTPPSGFSPESLAAYAAAAAAHAARIDR